MDFKIYFRWILSLPILLGLLFYAFPLSVLTTILTFSIKLAGIPSTIFCVLVLLATKNWPQQKLKRFTWFLPLLFVPLSFIGSLIIGGGVGSASYSSTFIFIALYTLVIGYFYVLVCWLIYGLLSLIYRQRKAA